MPAVAPSNSESYLLWREPLAKFFFSNLLIGFAHVCIALALLLLVGKVLIAAKAYKTPKPAQRSEQSTMDEKLVPVELHLLEQQRLYHHFPAHGFTIDDAVHQGPSAEVHVSASDSGRPGHVRFADGTFGSATPRNEMSSSDSGGEADILTTPPIVTRSSMIMSRPPPPPPLTPPELATTIFSIDGHRYSQARTTSELDTSFFQQPNPDYMSSTATAQQIGSATAKQVPITPRRRSYTRTIPINPTASSTPSPRTPLDISSSYPPTSYMLPGPPPGHMVEYPVSPQEIEVHGEIISALDDDGAGWTRHTRVYGGGVCLACASSGGEGHGGFYGKNVPPEHMR
ncbi:conserved hypothetical protein [Verticillium alfalfae VaMs.102]|uniref:Uncharacterized protein n=1 Tax=Verticillium alfalfae (strain VaMs.102 / ATCC MYA-4576 / FGSC 10136) TaxID=526221 RepID=C9S9D3_VERA1|nr:conserved hypothetical protein [Verticillium alfalfae VaMs.102]EEY15996.1 conserved hypothetical protein [Verticillium alfalfae VaMs.102]